MGLSDDNYEETENVVNRLNAARMLLFDWLRISGSATNDDALKMARMIFNRTLDFLRTAPAEPHADTEEVIGILRDSIKDLQDENHTLKRDYDILRDLKEYQRAELNELTAENERLREKLTSYGIISATEKD